MKNLILKNVSRQQKSMKNGPACKKSIYRVSVRYPVLFLCVFGNGKYSWGTAVVSKCPLRSDIILSHALNFNGKSHLIWHVKSSIHCFLYISTIYGHLHSSWERLHCNTIFNSKIQGQFRGFGQGLILNWAEWFGMTPLVSPSDYLCIQFETSSGPTSYKTSGLIYVQTVKLSLWRYFWKISLKKSILNFQRAKNLRYVKSWCFRKGLQISLPSRTHENIYKYTK